jgi:hypothetical protein
MTSWVSSRMPGRAERFTDNQTLQIIYEKTPFFKTRTTQSSGPGGTLERYSAATTRIRYIASDQ